MRLGSRLNYATFASFAALAWLLSASQPVSAQELFFEDFEATSGETYTVTTASLTGAPEWSFTPGTPNGRLRMNAGVGFARSGVAAATMDVSVSGSNVVNFLIATLDLSALSVNTDRVLLDFSFMHHGEESNVNDRVWVRGNNTAAFVEVANLNALSTGIGIYHDIVDVNVTNALLAAGQEFSSTFQIRFGQEDNFPATSPTGTDGFTFDDIRVRRDPSVDVGATAILSPTPEACGSSDLSVVVEVTNFGFLPATDVPVTVQVTGDVTDTLQGVLPGPIGQFQTATIALGPIDTFTGGAINLTATTALTGDEVIANDGGATASSVLTSLVLPVVEQPACPGSSALLSVEPPEPDVVYGWFNSDVGGSLLGVGSVFATPRLDAPATFFAARLSQPESIGEPDSSFATGNYHTEFADRGLVFDVSSRTTIRSVSVIPREAGEVTIRVRNSLGQVLGGAIQEVLTPDVLTPIQLDVEVPPGSGYRLDAVGTNVALFRNTEDASYPYVGTNITITGTTNPLTDSFYYFFYDWNVDGEACGAERTPVLATLDMNTCNIDLALTADAPATAIAGREVEYTVTVFNNGADNAYDVIVNHDPVAGAVLVGNAGACRTAFPCRLGRVDSGEQRVITTTFRIDSSFEPGTDLAESFTVGHSTPEAGPGDESAQAATSVGAEADLSLAMRAGGADVADNAQVTFALDVTNDGPSDARDVVIQLQLPAGVTFSDATGCTGGADGCTVGTVAAGETAQVVIRASVSSQAPTLTGSATVSSSATELDDANNSASATFGVVEAPGCGCRAGGSDSPAGTAWPLLLVALVLLRRRRK